MIAAAVVLFFAMYFLSIHIRRPADTWFYAAFINEYNTVGKGSRIYDDFLSLDEARGKNVVFDSNYFFDLSKESDYANRYYQKLVAHIEAGTVDVMILSEDNLSGIARGGHFLDLRDERVADGLSPYKENFYYYTTDEGESIPIGIRLVGGSYRDELGYLEDVYVAVSPKCDNPQAALLFIEMLMK